MATYLGKVLLIDDDFGARMALAEGLRARRWIVETAPSGRIGVDAAMKGQPDVVVTDLGLPEVASLSFARSLRTFIEHDVIVIGIASELDGLIAQARAAGFDDVFRKPVDAGALHTRLLAGPASDLDDWDDRATSEIEKLRR